MGSSKLCNLQATKQPEWIPHAFATGMNGWVFDECALTMWCIKYSGIRWLLVSSIFDTSPKKLLCIALPSLRSKRIDIPGTFVHRIQIHIKCFEFGKRLWTNGSNHMIVNAISFHQTSKMHSGIRGLIADVFWGFSCFWKTSIYLKIFAVHMSRLCFHWAIIFGWNGQFYRI